MHTIEPLDFESILGAAYKTVGIVSVEELRVTGGLGGAVAELPSCERPTRIQMVGLPYEFAIVDSKNRLREHYGLSKMAIAGACDFLLT